MFRKAFRYRLYPNKEQQAGLAVQFGHARFVYNWALAMRSAHYREHGTGIGYYDLKRMMTDLKRQPDHVWLKEADSCRRRSRIWTAPSPTSSINALGIRASRSVADINPSAGLNVSSSTATACICRRSGG